MQNCDCCCTNCGCTKKSGDVEFSKIVECIGENAGLVCKVIDHKEARLNFEFDTISQHDCPEELLIDAIDFLTMRKDIIKIKGPLGVVLREATGSDMDDVIFVDALILWAVNNGLDIEALFDIIVALEDVSPDDDCRNSDCNPNLAAALRDGDGDGFADVNPWLTETFLSEMYDGELTSHAMIYKTIITSLAYSCKSWLNQSAKSINLVSRLISGGYDQELLECMESAELSNAKYDLAKNIMAIDAEAIISGGYEGYTKVWLDEAMRINIAARRILLK